MGWEWDYTSWNVDLPRLRSMHKYWRVNPPTHLLVAAYMQYEPKQEVMESVKETTNTMNDQLAAFMAMIPQKSK